MPVRLVGWFVGSVLMLPLACYQGVHADEPAATPCSDVVPGCQADRLPNVTLIGGESDGAMGDVDDTDLSGIVSFDEALRLGASEDYGGGDAETVRVVLKHLDRERH